jgi:putative addiction module killer protein
MGYTIEIYEKRNKIRPFESWLDKQDSVIRNTIVAKLRRIGLGNLTTCKLLGNGISEIKIDTGPGYRIYYGIIGKKIILLLCAGHKKTQQKDIRMAIDYLNDYKDRGRTHAKK